MPSCLLILNDFIMKRSYASILALTLAAFSAGSAFASDASAPKSREQVKAELAEAVRSGQLPAHSGS